LGKQLSPTQLAIDVDATRLSVTQSLPALARAVICTVSGPQARGLGGR
jgi:hypothetical protein